MTLLLGWKRASMGAGTEITLQLGERGEAGHKTPAGSLLLELNDNQLCSLARDLKRAARERGLDPWSASRATALTSEKTLIERLNPWGRISRTADH